MLPKIGILVRLQINQLRISLSSLGKFFAERKSFKKSKIGINWTLWPFQLFVKSPLDSLSSATTQNEYEVRALLQRSDLFSWEFNRNWPDVSIFNLLDADYKKFLNFVAQDENFRHWYIAPLTERGVVDLAAAALVATAKRARFPYGVRLFASRELSNIPDSSFASGVAQGVDVFRWKRLDDDSFIGSACWNPFTSTLPNPRRDHGSFEKSIAEAGRLDGHNVQFPVDAVITWVDGDDPEWTFKKNRYLDEQLESVESFVPNATDASRFDSFDELKYCLRSIYQFAPWIRKVYIVTDQQIPAWLCEDSFVQVVDHTEIWKDPNKLPVFNSHAIEANLHRISGLSEHFLYFNDDFLLVRPISPETFFHANGISKVFFSRALVDFNISTPFDNVSTVAGRNSRELMKSQGFSIINRKFYHTPYPLSRSVLFELEELFSNEFEITSSSRFRSKDDLAVAGSLYFQYALAKSYAVPGRIKYDYIDPGDMSSIDRLKSILKNRSHDTIVINDGSSELTDSERSQMKLTVEKILSAFLPVKSPFERSKSDDA